MPVGIIKYLEWQRIIKIRLKNIFTGFFEGKYGIINVHSLNTKVFFYHTELKKAQRKENL